MDLNDEPAGEYWSGRYQQRVMQAEALRKHCGRLKDCAANEVIRWAMWAGIMELARRAAEALEHARQFGPVRLVHSELPLGQAACLWSEDADGQEGWIVLPARETVSRKVPGRAVAASNQEG